MSCAIREGMHLCQGCRSLQTADLHLQPQHTWNTNVHQAQSGQPAPLWLHQSSAWPGRCQRDCRAAARNAKRLKYAQQGDTRRGTPLFVEVEPDGSDTWRLDAVADIIRNGGVGILPTDTYPALVCDLEAKAAVQKIYDIKQMSPSKQLSILCRSLTDIGTYTLGFPVSQIGRTATFKLARQVLPGPYTFILHASKALPKQVTDWEAGKSRQRKSVGVRMPDDIICQTILSQLERPMLCSSVHVEQTQMMEIPEAAVLMDQFAGRGLDFIVDIGQRVVEGSTVIDMTGSEPKLVRMGKGNPSIFLQAEEAELGLA